MAVGGGSGAGGSSGAIKAGAAFVELFTNDTKLVAGLKAAQRRVSAYASAVQKVGAVALGAGVAGLGGAVAAVGGFLDRAKDLQTLATKLGVPVDRLSAFAYAAETTGVTLEELAGHFENLAERVHQFARDGTGEAADTFKQLNIDGAALAALAPDEQLIAIADAMRGVTNETTRLGMLSSIGGDKFQELNDLFKQGPAAIRGYMQEARELGIALTPEQAERAAAATKELNRAWAVGRGVAAQFAAALLPAPEVIQRLGERLVSGATAVRAFAADNRGLIVGAAAAAAGLTAAGAALVGMGTTLSVASLAAGKLAAGVALVAFPLGLVAAGVGGLGYLFATQTESGRAFGAEMGAVFGDLRNTAVDAWSGITAALGSGDLELAGRTGMAGLTAAWAQAAAEMQVVWAGFNAAVLDAFREGSDALAGEFARLGVLMDQHLGKKRVSAVRSLYENLPVVMGVRLGDVFGIGDAILGGAEAGPGVTRTLAEDAARARTAREADRLAGVLAARAAVDAAKAELARLVAEARGKAGWGDAGGEWGGLGKGLAAQMAGLDKSIGAFLGGASASQVFGQGTGGGLHQKMLAAENKQVELLQEQNDKLNRLLGKAVPLTFV